MKPANRKKICSAWTFVSLRRYWENDSALRTADELLSHTGVQENMVGTHVLNRSGKGVRSSADGWAKA